MSDSNLFAMSLAVVTFIAGAILAICISRQMVRPVLVIGPPEPMPGINIVPYEDENGNRQFEIHTRHWDVDIRIGGDTNTLYDGDTYLAENLKDTMFRLKMYHPPKD